MIELFGVGVADGTAGWLLRGVSLRISSGVLTVVVSRRSQERRAFLDAVSGRQIPQEGRVWVNGIPVAREAVNRLRARVIEVDLSSPLLDRRSLLWNTLAHGPEACAVCGCLRLPRPLARRCARQALQTVGLSPSSGELALSLDGPGRIQLRMARALARRPECLLAREVDLALPRLEAQSILGLLRDVARGLSLVAFASVENERLAYRPGDGIVTIDGGSLARG